MANRESPFIEITVLIKAYACGIFPMAESAEDPSLYWIELRGIIPLDRFYVSSRLARTVRSLACRTSRTSSTRRGSTPLSLI